jgi:uncharacterized membrane protein YhaH (DUF805 family)
VSFLRTARAPLGKLTVLSGRSSRREFWSYLLACLIAVWLVVVLVRLTRPELIIGLLGPALLVEYALFWAVSVRRLHDTGRSGWMLLVSMVPAIGLIWVVMLLASPADAGPNAYGPNPSGDAA